MQPVQIANLRNTADSLQRLWDLNKKFLAHATAHSTTAELSSALQVSGNSICIDCFGHLASATSRAVRDGVNSYLIEYAFLASIDGESVEVTRFYLSENGRLLDAPQAANAICDYNNTYVAKHICGLALLGALASPLFQCKVR
jgi:hypothetical protein